MIELVYLVCWTFTPVPMDCRIIRVQQESVAQCQQAVNNMKRSAPAWCDTGREPKTVENWLKATEDESKEVDLPKGDFI